MGDEQESKGLLFWFSLQMYRMSWLFWPANEVCLWKTGAGDFFIPELALSFEKRVRRWGGIPVAAKTPQTAWQSTNNHRAASFAIRCVVHFPSRWTCCKSRAGRELQTVGNDDRLDTRLWKQRDISSSQRLAALDAWMSSAVDRSMNHQQYALVFDALRSDISCWSLRCTGGMVIIRAWDAPCPVFSQVGMQWGCISCFLRRQLSPKVLSTLIVLGLVIRRTGIRMSSISKQGFREKEDAVVFEVVEQEAKR